MIDYFALALMHGLIALTVIRLLGSDRLDREPGQEEADRAAKRRRREGGRHA